MNKPNKMHRSWWAAVPRSLFRLAAGLFFLQLFLILTGCPRPFSDWLTAKDHEMRGEPDYAVVLGGGGIPSASGLLRTYTAAEAGQSWTNTIFVVALPAPPEPGENDTQRMRDELILRGIPAARIRLETRGRNTLEQARETRRLLGDAALSRRVLIISSPEHMRRAVWCFEHVGFRKVGALPAREADVKADLGGGRWLRYKVWYNWEMQARALREVCALAYYRLRTALADPTPLRNPTSDPVNATTP